MIFTHQKLTEKVGVFNIKSQEKALANKVLNTKTLKEFWHSFTYKTSSIEIEEVSEFIFKIGNAKKPNIMGNDYAINVESEGVYVIAKDGKSLIKGYITLLDLIIMRDKDCVSINAIEFSETPRIKNLMVHYCVFPDTKLYEVERFIRLAGAVKYTHIILEFWGMIKLDALKELSWQHGYTKQQIKPLIKMANELGIEVIPMFNHWGHASACRVMHGKHVVLNQNPSLQYLFSSDGWCYNIESPAVKTLLKNIRNELIELCGDGEYFHVGCDEAYGFEFTNDSVNGFCNFINEIASELKLKNRKVIAWGDMFISKHAEFNAQNRYTANAPDLETETTILNNIDKSVIIADWQYDATSYPVESSEVVKKAGYRVVICPWDRGIKQTDACVETAVKKELFGIMHTTWHTLTSGMPHVVRTACLSLNENADGGYVKYATGTAEILRKAFDSCGDYEKSGWSPYEIGVNT